jgi:hypothetical protein
MTFILSIIGEAHQDNAGLQFGNLILAGDYAPQGQPFLAGERAGLHVGLDPSRTVTVNMSCYSLCLALGNCIVRSCKAKRIQIGKALENGARRASSWSAIWAAVGITGFRRSSSK